MTTSEVTNSIERADRIFKMQMARHYEIGKRPLKERRKDLKRLLDAVLAHKGDIAEAVAKDLRKPALESDFSEVYPVVSEIRHNMKHLEDWAARKSYRTPMALFGTRSWLQPEPKGVVLIVSPWNFPFNLTLGPLASALAAGNCAILKPSESTPHSSALMAKIISEVFEPDHVALIEGEADVSAHLTSLPFHHIFFTGGPAIGKKVMAAAAQHLTSVTLELGGKSPAIVDSSAPIEETARKLVFGRCINSGQVCVAVDYVLAEKSISDKLLNAMHEQIGHFYGRPEESADLSAIVHEKHFDHLVALLDDAKSKGAVVEAGGVHDKSRLFFSPTILSHVSPDMRVMQEEIFGPILPVMTWSSKEEAIAQVHELERPLAYYIFSKRKSNIKFFLENSRAGSTAINEVFLQFGHPDLPFGGVNFSGIGKAHGEFGFREFSNYRSYLKKSLPFGASKFIMPPYGKLGKRIMGLLIKWL